MLIGRVCKKCGKFKLFKDLIKDKRSLYGHRAWCKDCHKKYCKENEEHIKGVKKEYRKNNKERMIFLVKRWQDKNKPLMRKYEKNYKTNHPDRYKAQTAITNAIAKGKLIRPETCSSCKEGGPVHGHHPDYSKPLHVVWVCPDCHVKIHKQLKEEA